MTITQKQAIVHSLEGMNSRETDKLMKYIRAILYNPQNDLEYLRRKRRGMKEIQLALSEANTF